MELFQVKDEFENAFHFGLKWFVALTWCLVFQMVCNDVGIEKYLGLVLNESSLNACSVFVFVKSKLKQTTTKLSTRWIHISVSQKIKWFKQISICMYWFVWITSIKNGFKDFTEKNIQTIFRITIAYICCIYSRCA